MTATPPGRTPGDGAPLEGTPEFEWLYGGKKSDPEDKADEPVETRPGFPRTGSMGTGRHRGPDDTRPVPQQPRPEQATPRQPGLPTAQPTTPPTQTPRQPGLPTARPDQRQVQQQGQQQGQLPPGQTNPHEVFRIEHLRSEQPRQPPGQPPRERPEDTQVMEILPPSQSRVPMSARERREQLKRDQERQSSERSSRPTPPPLAPTPGRSFSGGGFRLKFRYIFLLLLLWIIYLVLVPLVAWNKVDKIDAMPGGKRPADQPGTTYLLVGSDSRAGLSPEERKDLSTGGASGQRADTIMLLHTGSGPNLLMSIPRDSLVPIPGHGTTKINAATAFGGPKLMVRTIELNTGIRIDSYVEIGFGGFVGLVDAVGGIEICPDQDMVDPDAGLRIKKGCQDVDGKVALAYARSRKTQQLGDLDRAAHQREVVSKVGKKAIEPWSIINPLRYWNLNMSAADFVAIDDQSSPISAARLAIAMTKVGGADGLTCGVPISDLEVHWDDARSKRMFRLIKQDDTSSIGKDLCTPSGLAG
ncbi:LCP family protein [Nocardioides agariphilus]|nr:LCP family protein [Nocardioides agariphilus]